MDLRMKIGVIVAMDSEFERLSELIGASGRIGRNTVILVRSGIGKVNAALTAARMIRDERPDCILSSGCAGGLGEGVSVMDLVVGAQYAYHDVWCGEGNAYGQVQGLPARFDADARLVGAATGLQTEGRIHAGLIVSGDRFITDPAEEEKILTRFPEALAVDMESAAIAQTCYLEGVPFLSLRVVSDALLGDRAATYEDFWATVSARSFAAVRDLLATI